MNAKEVFTVLWKIEAVRALTVLKSKNPAGVPLWPKIDFDSSAFQTSLFIGVKKLFSFFFLTENYWSSRTNVSESTKN